MHSRRNSSLQSLSHHKECKINSPLDRNLILSRIRIKLLHEPKSPDPARRQFRIGFWARLAKRFYLSYGLVSIASVKRTLRKPWRDQTCFCHHAGLPHPCKESWKLQPLRQQSLAKSNEIPEHINYKEVEDNTIVSFISVTGHGI